MRVRTATVIGAGVMGSAIAAHLANAGIPVSLLDVVPSERSGEDHRPEHRNRLAAAGKDRALRADPPAFFVPRLGALVTVGNVEDDLHRVQESDWTIEAVIEDLAAKRALLERVERFFQPGTLVSTNTSGLSVAAMVEGRSRAFRQHFLGTHFFNPPRYMKLVELIPSPDTLPEVLAAATEFVGRALGKGTVLAKDTPNFIANRIGAYTSSLAVGLALERGYTVEEVDDLTGPLIGRPRTGTFRLADLVGLDTAYHVRKNVYQSLPHDPEREVFAPPDVLRALVERGWLGRKSGRGFYWRQGEATWVLDLRTLEYRERREPTFPPADAVRRIAPVGERIRALLGAGDRAATFVWSLLSRTLAYAACVLPEISDDVANVDRAMRWGFNWEVGPFELWDALGPAEVASRMKAEGTAVPRVVEQVVQGEGRFYPAIEGRRHFLSVPAPAYRPIADELGSLSLAGLIRAGRNVDSNASASLVDLGDGVGCVVFNSKLNTIDLDIIRMLNTALDRLERGFDALVIGTEAKDFSVGGNLQLLLLGAEERQWESLDRAVRQFQHTTQRIRHAPNPVVGAPAGRTLAGGAEICLACPRLVAAAETYMGLVETGVGLVPAGGGVTEVVRRVQARIPDEVGADLFPLVQWAFETIARARVSQSAHEAQEWGYLREGDGITMNPDRLIQDAKERALATVRLGYRPPVPSRIRVVGERGRSALWSMLYQLRTGDHITAYDEVVGRKLASVMAGGDVPEGTWVSEEYLLDLEREAFLGLLGEAKTQERIRHLLRTGKPLRN